MSQPVPASDPAAEQPGRRGRGCWIAGCIVLVLLLVLPAAGLWALFVAVRNVGPAAPREAVRVHTLPAGPGRIDLAVKLTELSVVRGEPGSPLRLEAAWDDAACKLDERLMPDGPGWRYSLHFGGRRLLAFSPDDFEGNRLKLWVPADRPFVLDGKVALGETDFLLGGLPVQRVDLTLGAGEHRFTFVEPTPQPMTLLRLDGSMGEITVLQAGNASPRRVDIKHGMGELTLDLTGRWRGDGDVLLRLGMGDSEVLLPRRDEAGAVVEQARVALGDHEVDDQPLSELPPGLPRVTVRATGGMGDLKIR
jgi:hypothetical protein